MDGFHLKSQCTVPFSFGMVRLVHIYSGNLKSVLKNITIKSSIQIIGKTFGDYHEEVESFIGFPVPVHETGMPM